MTPEKPQALSDVEFLICTIDEGIVNVPEMLLPPLPRVKYLVSWQHSGKDAASAHVEVPALLRCRQDVRVVELNGAGLSRNRNNALRHADGDLLIIADDDCRYSAEAIDCIRENFLRHPDAGIIQFQGMSYEGEPLHDYPDRPYDYRHRPRYTYVSSCELVLRRRTLGNLRFDERFGIGTYLACGEEELFVYHASRMQLPVYYEPFPIVRTEKATTGTMFAGSKAVQRAKGALLYEIHGMTSAILRCLKYAFYYRSENICRKIGFFYQMLKGIAYVYARHPLS